MFEALRQSLKTGVVTTDYPLTPTEVSSRARGQPEIDWAKWQDARPAAAVCPTGAIECRDESAAANAIRTVTLDLGKCIFCGLCADADPAIRMTNQCELAGGSRASLRQEARYRLNVAGTQQGPLETANGRDGETAISPVRRFAGSSAKAGADSIEAVARQLQARIQSVLGRSLHIREVDAGSCNGCEVEINGLNSPVYDLERFGIHFVASPRHADMLLVTGPVTRNMELALRKTYDATFGAAFGNAGTTGAGGGASCDNWD